MFAQAWNKYLPVIKILMKRSGNGEQMLAMNKTDFERAAGGRKAKLTFSLTVINGRNQHYASIPPPVAKDLLTVLQEDESFKQLLRNEEYSFTMNTSFQLVIKKAESVIPAAEETEDSSAAITE